MDTLQEAYRDEEDRDENPTHKSNTNENDDIVLSDPNPNLDPSTIIAPTTESLTETSKIPNPEPKPEPESEPMAGESTENPTTMTEPMAVESTENPTTTTTTEPMAVEFAENPTTITEPDNEPESQFTNKVEPLGSEDVSSDSVSEDEQTPEIPENTNKKLADEEDQEEDPYPKKQKSLSQFQIGPSESQLPPKVLASGSNSKKSSKKKKIKGNNVWTKSTSRKGKKKAKNNNHTNPKAEDTVLITPIPRFPDKNDDSPDMKICLSKFYKAEKVELSDDRLSAGSCKGYRMVRATRGVTEGAWYFEIKVDFLGETGHTRLGWSTEKGDLQAPVGYDANSFGYRDIDGSKIHKALREKYGKEGYQQGDVIGFYINLPEGNSYAPKPPHLVWYKGQKYVCAPDPKEDPPKVIPGSEISFFKNGICQGVAFKDLFGGRYYPAASMYTLPNQPNCVVKFNFGPDFECFPIDFEGRPIPRPMVEVPYHGFDNRVENGVLNDKQQ